MSAIDLPAADDRLEALVVVVTYNSEQDIETCIRSIDRHFSLVHERRAAVCVVDNASKDHTAEILSMLEKEFDWLHVCLQSENIGFGCGNNVAFQRFDADVYFLLNADAYLVTDSLSPALAYRKMQPELGVIGLPLVYPDGRPQTYYYAFSSWHRWALLLLGARRIALILLQNRIFKLLLSVIPYGRNFVRIHSTPILELNRPSAPQMAAIMQVEHVDWVSGAAMLLSADFVHASGGFDPHIFLYGEDEDLCIQAHDLGFDVVTLATAPIVHVLGWGTKIFRPKVARMKYDSLKYFIIKNAKGRMNRFLMLALLPFYIYSWRVPLMIMRHSKGER